MIRQAHIQTTLARISQPLKKEGLLFALTHLILEPCSPISIPSPGDRCFAWRDAEDDAMLLKKYGSPTLRLCSQIWWQATAKSRMQPGLRRRSFADGLRQGVFIERHLSRIFPCLTRSLASVLFPRPITPSRKDRVPGTPMLHPYEAKAASPGTPDCGTARLCFALTGALRVSAFRKSFVQRTQKRFPEPSEKAPLDLGSGAHSHPTTQRTCVGDPGISRHFVQECPE